MDHSIASKRDWDWKYRGLALFTSVLACILVGCEGAKPSGKTVDPESTMGEPLHSFSPQPIGNGFDKPPRISYIELVDLDQDGLLDILVCDCVTDSVSWIRQGDAGKFEELTIAEDLIAPARVEVVDFDSDGDLDIFVAVLGQLFPTNEKIGSLIALENQGNMQFASRVLLQDVARVSDVRCGDLDGDGDVDLAVTQFGYDDGEVQWREKVGEWTFESHRLFEKAGGIHGIISDLDGDSKLDIALLLSQQHEQVYLLQGNGTGEFRERLIYESDNPDYGSAGIWLCDLDLDGDEDVLYCNGDAFDYSPPRPWPWHGVQWLENLDGKRFRYRRLANFGGAVNAQPADYDHDGDIDIFVSSAFNSWDTPESQSLIVLENTGSMQFVVHSIANSPSHIQALAVGDINGDGRLDLVTGGMHVSEPYDRMERVAVWFGK